MVDAVEQYLRDVFKKYRYYATWPPGKSRALGDVGVFDSGVFDRRGSLRENFDVDFTERTDESPTDYTHASRRGVDVSWQAEGEVGQNFEWLANGKVGARVEFSSENAFVFAAPNCYEHEIEDKIAVKRAIVDLMRDPDADWDERYRVITDLVTADSATVLVAGSSNAAIEIEATGDVGESWFTIAGLGANARRVRSRGMEMEVVATEEVTPLFQYLRPKQSLVEKLVGLVRFEEFERRVDVEGMDGAATGAEVFDAVEEDEEFVESLFDDGDLADVLGSAPEEVASSEPAAEE